MTGGQFAFSLSSASGDSFATMDDWIPEGLQFDPEDPADVERAIREIESRLDAIAQQLTMTPKLEVVLAQAKSQVRVQLMALAQRIAAEGRA